jgi:hypothetical protein
VTLKKLPTYEEINGGAHRKPASILGAPSIVRHLAFWDVHPREAVEMKIAEPPTTAPPPAPGRPPEYQPDTHQQSRRTSYLDYLRKLNERLKERADLGRVDATPNLDRPEAEVGRNSADIFCFWWCGLRMTIRLEMESEYVTLTTIIDLSVRAPDDVAGAAGINPQVTRLKTTLASLERAFNDLHVARPDRYWKALRRRLQARIWQEVDWCLIDPDGMLDTRLGHVFADFRGLITGAESDPDSSERSRKGDHKLRKPFLYAEPVGSILRPRKPVPADSWRRDALDRLWPLIKSEHISSNFEVSASGYLDGRAVFVSALGPQSANLVKRSGGADDWTPLHYYLHTATHDEWQLGRLVNRMHNVATLRLAAIVRIGDLIEAGEIAEEIATLIESADDALREALATVSCAPPTDSRERIEYDARMAKPASAIADAEGQLARINKMFPLDITARLERSRHYIERFLTGADVFRVRRIEGFQLYKEFVSRRMNGLFSYIDLLHRRMDTIWAGMSELHRKNANLKMATVNCEIQSLTSEIGTVTKRIKDEDSKIKKIQDFGEIALIGILLPYYLGSILYHGLEPVAPQVVPFMWGALALTGSIIAMATISAQSRDDALASDHQDKGYNRKRNRFWWLFMVIALASIIFLGKMAADVIADVDGHHESPCKGACPEA